jgi:hypothetical protein
MDSTDCVLVSRINDPKIIQHRRRAGEGECSELVKQTTTNDIYISLSTEEIESLRLFRSVSPVAIIEFTASFPWRNGCAFMRADRPIVDHMLIDSVANLNGESEESGLLWCYSVRPGQ